MMTRYTFLLREGDSEVSSALNTLKPSACMCQELGVTKSYVKLMACSVAEWGWRIYRVFHQNVARWQ